MPHINLPKDIPGIRSAMAFRPETAKPLSELAHILLHEQNSLTPGERDLIATYVSSLNDCFFCQNSHGAIAAQHLNHDEQLVLEVKRDYQSAAISEKLKTLLTIAGKVRQGGKNVSAKDIERARAQGATDM